MSQSWDEDGVSCQKGKLEFCQQAAIAENKGVLESSVAEDWLAVSRECPNKGCHFNKVGKIARTLESREVCERQAMHLDREMRETFGSVWGAVNAG